jgi:LmbE family N-acetylglucosaminyl deacetylase
MGTATVVTPGVPDVILVMQAHPDDADISSGASIARWCREGARVIAISCTSGEAGRSEPPVSPTELGAMREQEQRDAAVVLGVTDVRFLHLPDGGLMHTSELEHQLVDLIVEARPGRLVTHDPWAKGEHHPDHLQAGRAALAALIAADRAGWRVPEVYLFRSDEPNTAVDVEDTFSLKLRAVEQHRSQRSIGEAPPAAIESWATRAGERWGMRMAETFTVLTFEQCQERSEALERLT